MYSKEINEADVRYILEHLRDEDRHEALIQKGENYIDDILSTVMKRKEMCLLGVKKSDDTPVCIGGYVDMGEGVGCVWLLSTPEIVNHQVCLLRHIKEFIDNLDKKFWLTFNMLYCENKLAKKWLTKLGFKFDNPHPETLNIPDDFEFFYRKRTTRGLNYK